MISKAMRLFINALILTLVFLANYAEAQWNTDSTTRNLISNSSGWDYGAKMIKSETGGIYVSWYHDINPAGTIFMLQKVDSMGYNEWTSSKMIVPAQAGGFSTTQHLISSPGGGGLMIWSPDNFIYMQKFNANGDTLFAPHKLLYTNGNSTHVRDLFAVADDSGGVILTWYDNFPPYNLKTLRVDSAGNPLWPQPKIIDSDIHFLYQIEPDHRNGFYCLYETSSSNLFIQRVDRNGNGVWGSPVLAEDTIGIQIQDDPRISLDSINGGAYFIYNKLYGDVYIQHIDSNGTFRWPGGYLIYPTDTNGISRIRFQIVTDISGGVFTSSATRNASSGTSEYIIHHSDSNINSLWNGADTLISVINDSALSKAGTATCDSLIRDGDGVIFVWRNYENRVLKIYSQRYNSIGFKDWQSTGFPVIIGYPNPSLNLDYMSFYAINFRPSSIIVGWDDQRNSNNWELFIAKIDGGLITDIDHMEFTNNDLSVYPNPVKSKLYIKSETKIDRATLFSPIGQIIFDQKNLSNMPIIDFSNYTPGIYVLKCFSGGKSSFTKIIK